VTACSTCNARKGNQLPEEIGMHPLSHPVEPHFVHLSWAVRRLTPIQAKYIRTFYGAEVLHQLEDLEHRTRHLAARAQRTAGSPDVQEHHRPEHVPHKPHGHHRH
jgi:hypothetical protein